MSLRGLFRRGRRRTGAPPSAAPRRLRVRVASAAWHDVRAHVEDFSRGEEAGFLICSLSQHSRGRDLLAREWHPIPEEALHRGEDGFVLSWNAAFNDRMLQRAAQLGAGLVLVHSHGNTPSPRFSAPDMRSAKELFPSLSRLLDVPCGTIVIGSLAADGCFWADGEPAEDFEEITVVGAPIERWTTTALKPGIPRRRRDRQTRALGSTSEIMLDRGRVAVIGCSGGGSHDCQQLAHAGIGALLPVDGDRVEDVNLGRMVGSEPTDIGAAKVDIMKRLIGRIDPAVEATPVDERFPTARALDTLKTADIVIAAVDSFLVREQINAFCRRYALPLVDIGMNIETADGRLRTADGQVMVVLPDSACMRCTSLLSNAVLERERRERPPGYDLNPNAGDPQVISMNGTLASEAASAVLDLLCGYSGGARGAGWWQYDGRRGQLDRAELPPRWPECPACAEALLGDPSGPLAVTEPGPL